MHRFHPGSSESHSHAPSSHKVKILILGNITDDVLFKEKWNYFKAKHSAGGISEIIAVQSDPVYACAERLAAEMGVLFILFNSQGDLTNLMQYVDKIFICVDEGYQVKEEIERLQKEGSKSITFSQIIPI